MPQVYYTKLTPKIKMIASQIGDAKTEQKQLQQCRFQSWNIKKATVFK